MDEIIWWIFKLPHSGAIVYVPTFSEETARNSFVGFLHPHFLGTEKIITSRICSRAELVLELLKKAQQL